MTPFTLQYIVLENEIDILILVVVMALCEEHFILKRFLFGDIPWRSHFHHRTVEHYIFIKLW